MTDEHTDQAATADAPSEPVSDAGKSPGEPVWAEKNPSPGLDVGQAEVQAKTDAAEEKGFIGSQIDPTPNENYSLETGPEAPTPETDPELAQKAKVAVDADRSVLNPGSLAPPIPEEG